MAQVFLALAIGFVISYYCSLPEKCYHIFSKLTTMGLVFLLFVMGIQIGSNPDITRNLLTIGWQAIVFSVFTIIASIGCVFILEKLFFSLKGKEEDVKQ